jgi:hypothetical protein
MTAAPPVVASGKMLLGLPGFAALTTFMVALSGLLLSLIFRGPGDATALITSAVLAIVVQVAAYPAIRRISRRNFMLGWGAGSLVRFLSLAIYALLCATMLHLPLPAALLSLAVFYFLSMVVEPLFLRL